MNKLSNSQLRTDWEERAIMQGASLSGVLLRNFSPALNLYLHNWHVRIMKTQILPHIPANGKILDVACGYGRISRPILDYNVEYKVCGLDFAYPYCKHYLERVNSPAICGSINHLPLANDFLDGLVAITALMYVENGEEKTVLQQLMQRVKPGSFALFIDPGAEFIKFVRRFRHSGSSTSGKGFLKKTYLELANVEGVEIVSSGGLPVFSMLLPLLYGLRKRETAVQYILQNVEKLDQNLGKYHQFTLHRWMLLCRTS